MQVLGFLGVFYINLFLQEVRIFIGDTYDTTSLRSKYSDLSAVDRRKQTANFVQDYLNELGQRSLK